LISYGRRNRKARQIVKGNKNFRTRRGGRFNAALGYKEINYKAHFFLIRELKRFLNYGRLKNGGYQRYLPVKRKGFLIIVIIHSA